MQYKKLSEIAEIKFCTASPSRAKLQDTPTQWLGCSSFLADNTMSSEVTTNYVTPDPEWKLQSEDIVIKRITPTFINYVEIAPEDVFCGNNLIVISACDSVYSRYLAMILNDKIKDLSVSSSVGAVMKSVSRNDLEALDIPIPSRQQQELLGNLWYSGIELKKNRMRLVELENTRNAYLIKNYIHSLGGRQNG